MPFDITFHLWDAPPTDPTYGFFGLFIGDDNDNTSDELSDSHVTFRSSQGPMWGSFYGRDGPGGGPAEVVNRGIDEGDIPSPSGGMLSHIGPPPAFDPLQSLDAAAVKSWILVPDTYAVPEPATIVLAGQLAVFGLLKLKRLRKRNCS